MFPALVWKEASVMKMATVIEGLTLSLSFKRRQKYENTAKKFEGNYSLVGTYWTIAYEFLA